MEALWLPTILNLLRDVPHWPSSLKDIVTCFGRLGVQGSAITAFNPFGCSETCADKGFSSFCQVVAGVTQVSTTKVYRQCWKEWAG